MKELEEKVSEESRVWYAVQTLYCKEEQLGAFFKERGLNYFIPMRYEERVTLDGKKQRILIPAVHNLLFLEKTIPEHQLREELSTCTLPCRIIRNRETGKFYEIRDREMVEFRAICDPGYEGTLYVDVNTAEARPGQLVRVIRGNFAGLTGKLTRYKNRSYVVITIATLGVMVHIPKWYCAKID